MPSPPSPPESAGSRLSLFAVLVAAGMLISRIAGYARVVLFSAIFGVHSDAADAYNAALRIPNFLQNLLGEGVLSASLIPVYTGLLRAENQAKADQVARAVLGVLALVTSVLVLCGMVWTPQLVHGIAPGFEGPKRDLTVHLVRVMFPGIGLLVVSAWCLAILNSHHRFFVSYVAPVLWNAAIFAALVIYRHSNLDQLALRLGWAAVIGCALQLGVQTPAVIRIMSAGRTGRSSDFQQHVRTVLLTSVPVIFTRGVVQVSAYVDGVIASLLGTGALTALGYAQQLYQLPVSLFGMAVSSAALPTLAAASADGEPGELGRYLMDSQRMVVVLVVPSTLAFLAFGDAMVAMLFQRGNFDHEATLYVWAILAGSAFGLLATTVGRLYSAAFYALGDTRTPTTFAIVRVALVAALGYLLAVVAPPHFGVELRWGAAGLTLSAGFAGWVEFALLRQALRRRLGAISVPMVFIAQTWATAVVAAALSSGLRWVIPTDQLVLRGLTLLGLYGGVYLFLIHVLRLFPIAPLLRQILRPGRRRHAHDAAADSHRP